MPGAEARVALTEIKDNIDKQDFIKARLVMDHFPNLTQSEQKSILFELAKATDDFAVPLLCYLVTMNQSIVSEFPTIPDTISAKAVHSSNIIIEGIAGDVPETYYYLKLAGQLNIQKAVPNLIKKLLKTEEKRLQLADITSLGTLANPDAINAITEFLYVDDSELIRAAITALGQIATPTAIQRLSAKFGINQDTDFQILDIFAEIQDDISLRKLNETLQSRSAQNRNHARLKLTKIGIKAVPMLIENLLGRDSDQQILSLNILQQIGDESAALAIRNLINNQPKSPNVRFAAFEALADLSTRKGDYVLAGGLSDPDSNVRLTAAKAIDRNLDKALLNGVKNIVNHPGAEAINITKAIIDAQTENLFSGLIESEYFQETAIAYLGQNVHKDIRTFYIDILIKTKFENLADRIKHLSQSQSKQLKGRVCVVDDSKMVLHLYRSIITELGYEVILFSEPLEAISWLKNNKPDFLCTDLNMPEITGIELIQEVRKKYSKKALPVFLVTTQNEIQDNKAAWKAGVNEIMFKPFDSKIISAAFNKTIEDKNR